jgi:DNA ligase (NAD+)
MISAEDYLGHIKCLNEWTKAYDEGHPMVSDKEWDDWYFEVVEYEREYPNCIQPDSPTQVIHFEEVSELKKVKHNHPMLSLNKTKDIEEVKSFIGDKDYIVMAKMDGLTCSLHYEGGKLVSAETRGNGEVGEDITHNAIVIPSIPKRIPIKDSFTVDGEIICTYANFHNWCNDYKNPRNFAAGSIRLLNSKECKERDLTFVAWDIIDSDFTLLSDKLDYLDCIGFTVVPYLYNDELNNDIEKLMEAVKYNAKMKSYPIDGLVIKYNRTDEYEAAGRTDHHFKGGLAYKFYDEEYETEVENIEWTMGRTGQLTPVLIYKDIDIDGSTCNHASLHNISIMTKLMGGAYPGQKVYIYKANQIIPQVSYAQNDNPNNMPLIQIPSRCPYCGGEVEIRKDVDSEVLYCTNPQCEGKLINVLDHFCGKKGLDIKGLSEKTLEKLIDWEWVNDITDIPKLKEHRAEWINKPGFGQASVDKILKAIDDRLAEAPLHAFISGLGIPLIGSRVSKQICEKVETWRDFRDLIHEEYDFTQWAGFGYEMNKALHNYNYEKADIIVEYITFKPEEYQDKSTKLDNATFVITGKLQNFKNRQELVDLIEAVGGKVQSSVSTKTMYLINNDVNSTSSKNKKAKELNIPIITEKELMEMLNDKNMEN